MEKAVSEVHPHVPTIRVARQRWKPKKDADAPREEALPSPARTAGDVEPRQDANRITVEGYTYTLDFEKIAKAGSSPATWIFWIDLLSRAEREQIVLDARYRRFRADAICRLIESEPKIAEWRARAILERTEAFQENMSVVAEAQRNVTLLRGVIDALRSADTSPASKVTDAEIKG